MPGARAFEHQPGGEDHALRAAAAERAAEVLVRGSRADLDEAAVSRVVTLARDEGIDALAEVWAGSPADSLSGCLWRLYVIREFVHANPLTVARDFAAGRSASEVAEVVAGVVDPPGPDAVRDLTDQVLRGIVTGDFADTLFRAAAFTRVLAHGHAVLSPGRRETGGTVEDDAEPLDAGRLLGMAEQLEAAGHLELSGQL
ncbi:hypothetical protein KLP28_15485 [Nocardioidaceae bacterium]|nr:hypothetical protein KLP28_15485 [Nocardioidaceae bacterium]